MILTCPECATSYFVDDAKVPAGGRLVKCTSCGARWTAMKEAAPAPAPAAPRPAPAKAPEPFVPAAADDLEVVPIDPAALAAARAARTAPKKEAAGKVAVWAAAGLVVAALIVSAILFRAQIVRIFPASQAAYAGLGMPVNALGLVIENVTAKPVFQGGRPVLAVAGVIRSLRDEAAVSPPIRINLLDRAGKPVASKIATPLDANVPGHAVRHFAIAILDPPASVHDLEVTFEAAKGEAARGPPAVHAPVAAADHAAGHALVAASGPAPEEAKPLTPGSQDALPQHD
jgi:predicted Zn finger-like uncharacterized protein